MYKFFIAGRARNKDYILKICDMFDKIFKDEEELEAFLKSIKYITKI